MVKEIDELTEEDWSLYRIVSTPAIFSEFVRSTELSPFRLWPKQVTEMNREDLHIKRIQARDLGKSITAMDQVNSKLVQYDGIDGIALVGTRSDQNLQPIFERLIALYERNRFLKFFLRAGDRAVDRKNHEIRLINNAIIKGRIQGKDGQGFNTVHPDIIAWLDEAQLLDDSAIEEFWGMVNATLPILASGVPNGVRTSWAYRIDTDKNEGFAGGHMTRLDDPRVTPEFLEGLKRTYGGETSNGYRQKVMGEWGADARMTFDIDRITHDMPLGPTESRGKAPPYYRSIVIDEKDLVSYSQDEWLGEIATRFMLRPDMPPRSLIYISADHGDTRSPTTGYVHFFDTKERCWRQYLRFLLYGMQAPHQADVFHYLSKELNRLFGVQPLIGFDTTGGGGRGVASILENMKERIIWANVSQKVTFGERLENDLEYQARLDKDPYSGEERQMVNIELPLRQIAIPHILIPNLYSGFIRIVEQEELWKQLAGTTDHEDKQGTTGRRVFETDYSHDGDPYYNHDLSSFEVFAAMILAEGGKKVEEQDFEAWIEDYGIEWGDSAYA